MTTCIYCEKEKDSWGDYKNYDCPKIQGLDYAEAIEICDRCKYYIHEGEEVPV